MTLMDLEGVTPRHPIKRDSWKTVLTLAYQSLGVVYGDLSTSPLYVYKNTFAEDIQHSETNEEIYGVLSFVFWTLTLIPLLKYVFIVLRADDNGEGGTFALYSLLCRHARVSSLPNCQLADEELSEYKKDGVVAGHSSIDSSLKSTLEKHKLLQGVLLVVALVGACMVIGDGVLTPAISVFSAVSGLELSMSKEHHHYVEVPIACAILIFLFALQHYGTHRVGFLFAPIVLMWLICISLIGIYNIFRWNPLVYQALSPVHMFKFLKKTQRGGWMSLGGILLCITGSEAMYADLGHFSQLSIQIAFSFVVYPSLILAYMGQAAYLSKHHIIESNYRIGFYVSVPEAIRWPVLGVAILAAVVGSQAVITGTFSIIKQCSALGCFPRVKIVHTSSKAHGQIYIPEINWTLMLLCLAVTIGFRDTKRLGNASGLAVITVMLVTTCLMSVVMVVCWHKNLMVAVAFTLFFGFVEGLYFSAALIKFLEGAWVPIALSFIIFTIMFVWHYGTVKKYEFDVQNKVSINWLLGLGHTLGIARVRGIGLIHTELVTGIPAIFSHFVTNLPAFHQVLVFLCVKSVPVPHVRPEERFLVGRVGPKEYHIYNKTQLQVYSWGWGDFGRLGHGNSSDLFIPQPIQALLGMQIKQIACGDSHCLALSMEGDVWSWGRNQNGQLGLGTSEDSLVPQKIQAFQGVPIKMVAAGAEHTVAVSEDGELYGWGWGRYGNLGLGDRNDRLVPQKVNSSNGEKMTQVACGWRHTISVTSSGGLYTYGWSKYGQLGHGDFEDHLVPHKVEALREYFITEISGGWRHTMALTSDGKLFGWGWNKFGQVGVGDNVDHCFPVQLKFPHEQKVVQISCGWRHTLAVTDRQNVFSWGRNTNGQLGHGEAIDRNVPKLIDVLSGDGSGVRHLATSMDEPSSGKVILSLAERYAVVPGETAPGRPLVSKDASMNDASVPQGDVKRMRI